MIWLAQLYRNIVSIFICLYCHAFGEERIWQTAGVETDFPSRTIIWLPWGGRGVIIKSTNTYHGQTAYGTDLREVYYKG